jgi:hypothetical protein
MIGLPRHDKHTMRATGTWQGKPIDVFWAEMAACEHRVQIYDDDASFLDALEAFVLAGLTQDEAVILIATDVHLALLGARLQQAGHDVPAAIARRQLLTIDAPAALARFMRDGWPDETLFHDFVAEQLGQVRPHYPTVRAFGEMVALLWANGEREATLRLEHLWARLCKSAEFSLFCAYPRAGFTQDAEQSMRDVHLAHAVVFNQAG